MLTRRTFIKNSSILSSALFLDKGSLLKNPYQQVGLQMYTLRKLANDSNIAEVLLAVTNIGYKKIEIFGYTKEKKFWGMDPKPFKALLKLRGLSAPSAHMNLESFFIDGKEDELKIGCEAANIIETEFITVAWLDPKLRTSLDGYKRVAEKLNRAGKICQEAGLRLAYHNHDFEFKKWDDEKTGYEIILNETDKTLVNMELDIYWVTKAGMDPVKLIEDNYHRFVLWHLKDMDKVTGAFTELGTGTIDFKRIFRKREFAGMTHFFVEQDEITKGELASITESYVYVIKELLYLPNY